MRIARILRNALSDLIARVGAINERYATPRIPMSRAVRLSLLTLRIYLLLLVALLVYKFVTLIVH
jgi:hypothetical protein